MRSQAPSNQCPTAGFDLRLHRRLRSGHSAPTSTGGRVLISSLRGRGRSTSA
jgi:hypothetical protein